MTLPNGSVKPPIDHYLHCLNREDQIHRYCKIDELYSLFQKKLTLTCPYAWEDDFEHPLFRADLKNKDGKPVDLKEAGRKFYCQSWTLKKDSDAMWKLFGDKGKGVRITVKTENLFLHAYNGYHIMNVETRIGKVLYVDEKKLRQKFETDKKFYKRFMKKNGKGFFESLLFKRNAYSYEKEVRLIAQDFFGRFGCSETMRLKIPVCGCDWIENVTFGPAVGKDTYKAHRKRLTKLGLLKEKIARSQLYGKLKYNIDLSKLDHSK